MSTLIYESFLRRQNINYEKSELGLLFSSHGKKFILADSNNDDLFLQLVMPVIYKLESSTEECKVLKAMNDINCEIKVIKACLHGDSVWLHIEMFMDKTPNIEDYFFRLLDILLLGQMNFLQKMLTR